ncbi:hypothetical protein B0H14DRAFT_2559152 [Mycena olivaceomarginata]|nr:hypothetical protein B0H14DRAFT_2559152 [Mycena olivaceomarginata]
MGSPGMSSMFLTPYLLLHATTLAALKIDGPPQCGDPASFWRFSLQCRASVQSLWLLPYNPHGRHSTILVTPSTISESPSTECLICIGHKLTTQFAAHFTLKSNRVLNLCRTGIPVTDCGPMSPVIRLTFREIDCFAEIKKFSLYSLPSCVYKSQNGLELQDGSRQPDISVILFLDSILTNLAKFTNARSDLDNWENLCIMNSNNDPSMEGYTAVKSTARKPLARLLRDTRTDCQGTLIPSVKMAEMQFGCKAGGAGSHQKSPWQMARSMRARWRGYSELRRRRWTTSIYPYSASPTPKRPSVASSPPTPGPDPAPRYLQFVDPGPHWHLNRAAKDASALESDSQPLPHHRSPPRPPSSPGRLGAALGRL